MKNAWMLALLLIACEPPIPDGVYQTNTLSHRAGELVLLGVDGSTYFDMRCADDACTAPEREDGIVPSGYVLEDRRLLIDGAELDAIDETLCDETMGIWADDDVPPSGLWCDCGAKRAWSAAGCR